MLFLSSCKGTAEDKTIVVPEECTAVVSEEDLGIDLQDSERSKMIYQAMKEGLRAGMEHSRFGPLYMGHSDIYEFDYEKQVLPFLEHPLLADEDPYRGLVRSWAFTELRTGEIYTNQGIDAMEHIVMRIMTVVDPKSGVDKEYNERKVFELDTHRYEKHVPPHHEIDEDEANRVKNDIDAFVGRYNITADRFYRLNMEDIGVSDVTIGDYIVRKITGKPYQGGFISMFPTGTRIGHLYSDPNLTHVSCDDLKQNQFGFNPDWLPE